MRSKTFRPYDQDSLLLMPPSLHDWVDPDGLAAFLSDLVHELDLAPFVAEDERVRLADLRREQRTMREIAALMGRSPSTISRELARGADATGRYGPFEAHRRALGRRRLHRAQPPGPGRRAARLGRRQAPGTLEPRAGRSRAAPPVPRPASAMAVRRDDLPGRLSA